MNNEEEQLPDGCYQLRIGTRLVNADDNLVGCCSIRIEGSDDITPLGEMDEDARSAIIGLLLKTMLLSLSRQEVCRGPLLAVLQSLDSPGADAISYDSEGNTLDLEQLTKGTP